MLKKNVKSSFVEDSRLIVIEGKNDYLIIGVVMLLLAFFLAGGFLLR
jgi:hypothetical protein